MATKLSNIQNSPFWTFSEIEVKQICQPLFDQFGLNYFDYARFYPDNTSIQLFSDPIYVQFLLTDKEFACPPGRISEGKHLWISYINNHFLDRISSDFDHYHGITYIRQCSNYVELINFAAPKVNEKILSIFSNNEETLDYFIATFIKLIQKFLDKANSPKNRIILPENFLGPLDKVSSDIEFIKKLNQMGQANKESYLFRINGQIVALTQRETQCLVLLVHGWCTKKISRYLNISPRTVEYFCNQILLKSDTTNRMDLLGKLDINAIKLSKKLYSEMVQT